MEKIISTSCVKNELLKRVKEERNILSKIKRGKVNWIGHISPWKNVVDGKAEGRLEMEEKLRKKTKTATG
jgi:hypothetical protein